MSASHAAVCVTSQKDFREFQEGYLVLIARQIHYYYC